MSGLPRVYLYDHLRSDSFLTREAGLGRLAELHNRNSPYHQLKNFCLRQNLNLHPEPVAAAEVADPIHIWINLLQLPVNEEFEDLYRRFHQKKTNIFIYFGGALAGRMQCDLYHDRQDVHLASSLKDINDYTPDEILGNFHTQTRSFNRLYFHGDKVSKVVNWSRKGESEYFFYRHLPAELKSFFPLIYDSKHTEYEFIYEMEFIRSFDLSFYYVHDRLSDDMLKGFLHQVGQFFAAAPGREVSATAFIGMMRELVVEKCRRRMEDLFYLRPEYVKRRFRAGNGVLTIGQIFDRLCEKLEIELASQGPARLVFSHGDLSFGNVLWCGEKRMKLVDPRGALDYDGLFFPVYYDLAKISHCVNGNYDGILNSVTPKSAHLQSLFNGWLDTLGISKRLVYLTETSLFLSLLALHIDNESCFEGFIQAAGAALERE